MCCFWFSIGMTAFLITIHIQLVRDDEHFPFLNSASHPWTWQQQFSDFIPALFTHIHKTHLHAIAPASHYVRICQQVKGWSFISRCSGFFYISGFFWVSACTGWWSIRKGVLHTFTPSCSNVSNDCNWGWNCTLIPTWAVQALFVSGCHITSLWWCRR